MGRITCAIDCGMSGGIAIIVDGKVHALYKMPVFEIEVIKNKKKSKQKHIDVDGLYKILEPIFKNNKPSVYVEEVTHLFGLPSTSNFRLGYACGVVHGVLQTLGEFYLVHQKKWIKIWDAQDIVYEIDKKTGKTKMQKKGKSLQPKINTKLTSLNTAQRLYPDANLIHDGGRVTHDGCIDALLIGTFGETQ